MFRSIVLVLTIVLVSGCARTDDTPRQVIASFSGSRSGYSVTRIGAVSDSCVYETEAYAWQGVMHAQVMRIFDNPDSAIAYADRAHRRLISPLIRRR